MDGGRIVDLTPGAAEAPLDATRRRIPSEPALPRCWDLTLSFALAVAALVVGASLVVLAVAHADDRYGVDFVSGTWMALADYAADGTLYPSLRDGGYYGGTRYMPLPILLDGVTAKMTGELLVSAKLVSYLVALALSGIALAILRSVACPLSMSLALLAAVVVTPTGLLATLGVRNDGLAVVLQLAAVLLVIRGPTATRAAFAGALCTLAILSKISAIWAPAAITIWLLMRKRSDLRAFLAGFGVSLAVGAIVFELLSGGRLGTNISAFAFAGDRGPAGPLTDGVQTLMTKFTDHADAVWLLFPLAIVATLVRLRSGTVTLLQVALLVDLVVLSVVMSDRYTDFNHLIDLCVLTVLVVGELAGTRVDARRGDVLALVAVAAVLWGIASSYQQGMGPETASAARGFLDRESVTNSPLDPRPLKGLVGPEDRILSEDPTIPLLIGQRPVLVDPFTARIALAEHPEWTRELVGRIRAREFDKVILVSGLAPGSDGYGNQFLGRTINDAVQANYEPSHAIVNLYVYVPKDLGG